VISSLIFKLAKYRQKVGKKKMKENEVYFERHHQKMTPSQKEQIAKISTIVFSK
jgi:hypothetical protein